ncbi:hypothetical protein HZ994_06715 [Akkermansiaceae bacterium]|nr:hypothetical protein HZ994_06715 [Akkermansiaceae bacterium]
MNPKSESHPSSAGHRRMARRGFALVATLTMMVLLVLLAVGLLSLSAVSLRASSQNSAMAAAQANARMALMLAIGQLQSELGPDSRISAPHDLAGGDSGGRPHWTAVYDAWKAPDPASNVADSPGDRKVVFRKWLVSGEAGTTADEILLVGPGTLGSPSAAVDQVRVPSQKLDAGSRSGRIAWWTSDEGMKARINAGPDDSPLVQDVSNPLFHVQSPPHPDHRVFAALGNFEWKDGQREMALSQGQVNLAAGLGKAGLGSSFHDLTVHSEGVLADVRTGRLKRDLTQLLSRPLSELEDKPLYLADGRINRFDITPAGVVANRSFVGPWSSSRYKAAEWGINLEELALFHNIHREIDWSGGVPTLATKDSADGLAMDRFYMYGKPAIEAIQFILCLQAVQTGGTAADPIYKMQMMCDGMVVLANPNDVRLRFPPGLVKFLDLITLPYDVKLKITKANGSILERKTIPPKNKLFVGYIEGGFGGMPADGFDLEPGEAAAFGSTTASGYDLNIRRGFVPSGGVSMSWNLNVTGLKKADMVDFELLKTTAARNNSNSNMYYQAWHGNPGGRRIFESANLTKDSGAPDGDLMNAFLPEKILPPQVRPVSDFIDKPQPIMVMSVIKNVEQSSSANNPDALPSRPFLLDEPATGGGAIWRNAIPHDLHASQLLFTAEPLNYQFRSLAAGAGGRNVYHGGGRQPSVGGEFRVIKRRIPLAPPLSLGAFENAIAGSFGAHFGEVSSAWGTIGPGVDPDNTALASTLGAGFPVISKAIGNSFTNPFLAPGQVYRPGSGSGTVGRVATDPSWMVNTALWDSWFLSGIVDGSGTAAANPMKDLRTPRAQFRDLAEGTGTLRNTRFRFHPHKSPEMALDELFTGEGFKGAALNTLGKYLLIDGAFNVNSTSAEAWTAMFRSVAGQELLGSTKTFTNPFCTLGYTASEATSGPQGDWSGLRDLTDAQITDLAKATVEEVKARGPFLSMADFVNRRPNSGDSGQQVLGALQAAIDKSGLNDRFTAGNRKVTQADLDPLDGNGSVANEPAPARAIGAAGHLRQANILTALGSQTSVRSDTFVVRAYGDSRDKAGNIQATAYCEAVVQRVPEFLDPSDPPEVTPVSPVNQLFGRAFRMVSFRWLAPSEI